MSKGVYSIVSQTLKKVQQPYIVLDGTTKKIKKIYVTVNGLAKECFGNAFGGFTGAYTITDVIVDGSPKKLYTITESGTLTLNSEAQYWMCGGGGGGGANKLSVDFRSMAGGGGGGGYVKTGSLSAAEYTIVIGAGGSGSAGGYSSIQGSSTLKANGGSAGGASTGGAGGSGGGPAPYYGKYTSSSTENATYGGTGGKGDGVETLPFGVAALDYHCAGGSGGCLNTTLGRKGGSNGTNAQVATAEDGSYTTGVVGGVKGGGTGGCRISTLQAGSSATFYGSGGGGSGNKNSLTTGYDGTAGGNGYQGVVYILTE